MNQKWSERNKRKGNVFIDISKKRDEINGKGDKELTYFKERKGGLKFTFWNVAGLKNKDRDVWNFIEGCDFISLVETWIVEKDISYIEKNLAKDWIWKFFQQRRRKRKVGQKAGF